MYLTLMLLRKLLYYIPIFFQAARGTSAINSGIRMIALDASRILFIIISGILVSKYQHYVSFHVPLRRQSSRRSNRTTIQMPYMVVGTAINIIGAGLFTTLGLSTSTALSTSFLVVSGIGAGSGGNQPSTALQAVLSDEDLPIGNGLTVFGLQLGTAAAFAISQTVFLTKVFHTIESNPETLGITRSQVLQAGASRLQEVVRSPKALNVVRQAYSDGTRDTMVVALVAICLSTLCLPGMKWSKLTDGKKVGGKESELDQIQS
jgi:hypothetical protein